MADTGFNRTRSLALCFSIARVCWVYSGQRDAGWASQASHTDSAGPCSPARSSSVAARS